MYFNTPLETVLFFDEVLEVAALLAVGIFIEGMRHNISIILQWICSWGGLHTRESNGRVFESKKATILHLDSPITGKKRDILSPHFCEETFLGHIWDKRSFYWISVKKWTLCPKYVPNMSIEGHNVPYMSHIYTIVFMIWTNFGHYVPYLSLCPVN